MSTQKQYGLERGSSREHLEAVVLSLEDELSALDLRYASLLREAQAMYSDDEEGEQRREDVASATARVVEAMRLKGQQVRQLREYCRMLPV